MYKGNYIFEGYFNDVDNNQSDDIVRDIEQSTLYKYGQQKTFHFLLFNFNTPLLWNVWKNLSIDKEFKRCIDVLKLLNFLEKYSYKIRVYPYMTEQHHIVCHPDKVHHFDINSSNLFTNNVKICLRKQYDYCFDESENYKGLYKFNLNQYYDFRTRWGFEIVVDAIVDENITYKEFLNDMKLVSACWNRLAEKCKELYETKPNVVIVTEHGPNKKWKNSCWLLEMASPTDFINMYSCIVGEDKSANVEQKLHYDDEYSMANEHKWIERYKPQ